MFRRRGKGHFRNFHGQRLTRKQLKFFFVFCPNNSGTTVLSQFIAGQLDGYLPPFGNQEGQMAPAVKHIMRANPWDAAQQFDWGFIRQEWERLAQGSTFVEASPPNLIRADQIKSTFGADSTALISICNPYQFVASCLRRYKTDANAIRGLANDWRAKATYIADLRDNNPWFAFIRYEDFVRDPTILNKRYDITLRDVDVRGKSGSGLSGVKSGYPRAMGFLQPDELNTITQSLATQPDLLKRLGYDLADDQTLLDAQSENPAEFQAGQTARLQWTKTHTT